MGIVDGRKESLSMRRMFMFVLLMSSLGFAETRTIEVDVTPQNLQCDAEVLQLNVPKFLLPTLVHLYESPKACEDTRARILAEIPGTRTMPNQWVYRVKKERRPTEWVESGTHHEGHWEYAEIEVTSIYFSLELDGVLMFATLAYTK